MLSSYMQRERFKVFYVYVQNKLVITTDTKDIARKIAIQHGFKNFEITETKKADDNANENGYFLEPVKNGFKICEPKPKEKSLSELKSEKLSELTAITSKFDNQLVNNEMIIKSSLGFSINADLRSQNNLRGLIAVGVEPVNFVTADNSVKSLTLEQLNVLLKESIENGKKLYETKWKYRDMILNSSSTEELNAIEFKFTMSDFSVS